LPLDLGLPCFISLPSFFILRPFVDPFLVYSCFVPEVDGFLPRLEDFLLVDLLVVDFLLVDLLLDDLFLVSDFLLLPALPDFLFFTEDFLAEVDLLLAVLGFSSFLIPYLAFHFSISFLHISNSFSYGSLYFFYCESDISFHCLPASLEISEVAQSLFSFWIESLTSCKYLKKPVAGLNGLSNFFSGLYF